jgi:N6-adenosine-specific RNA methylase IME4
VKEIAYKCVVADPPWQFGDKLPGPGRGAVKNYSVMTVEDICGMGCIEDARPAIFMCNEHYGIADDALLFLWRVSSQVEEAYRVVRAWGFVPKSEIVWIKASRMMDAKVCDGSPEEGDHIQVPKVHFGMGRYVRASHETCIIAARGKAIPLIKNHSTRSIFTAVTGAHSQKPEEFYKIVEELCVGPRLELFSRAERKDWMCVGDEISPQAGDNLLKEAQ